MYFPLEVRGTKPQGDHFPRYTNLNTDIPFNAINYAYYQPVIDVVASCGPGFKGPSFHDIKRWLLQNEVQRIDEYLIEFKESWSKIGCAQSCLMDGLMEDPAPFSIS
jgi:hypothetical protein